MKNFRFHFLPAISVFIILTTGISGCSDNCPTSPEIPEEPILCIASDNQVPLEEPDEVSLPSITDNYPTLEIVNYTGNTDNTHPKVLYIQNGWRGYKYWMAYTPYPKADDKLENPCIAVSNDGYEWTVPEGLVNPVEPMPDYGYNSDTHLVFNPERDEMELWWRDVKRIPCTDAFWRRISHDGVNWGEKELILDYGNMNKWRLSPTVFIEEDHYICYYSDTRSIKVMKSGDGLDLSDWSTPVTVPIDMSKIHCWHLDVIPTNLSGRHIILIASYYPGTNCLYNDLHYSLYDSTLGKATTPVPVLLRDPNKDSKFSAFYRSSIVRIDDYYRIYFASFDRFGHRHISAIEGPRPYEMIGWKEMSNGDSASNSVRGKPLTR